MRPRLGGPSSRTPTGSPSPSPSPIHFVPLPRLVFPTAEPPFSPVRNCRPGRSHPTSADLLHPAPPTRFARLPARLPLLPTSAIAASRLRARGIRQAGTAMPRRFAQPIKYPRSRPGSEPSVGLAYRVAASVWAAKAQSTPIAHRSLASAASSWQKLINPPALRISTYSEAEPIFETRSRNSNVKQLIV